MRIVLDTNIYIAAALHDSFSALIVEILAEDPDFIIIISEEILNELEEKLRNKFKWLEEDINLYLTSTKKICKLVKIEGHVTVVTRDPKDNKILECAIAGEADLIVTLDQDLIKLKSFKGIGIIHPKTLSWTLPEYFKKNKG